MFFEKSCPRCSGDIILDSDINSDNSYDLFCVQCGTRPSLKASVIATLLWNNLQQDRKKSWRKTTKSSLQ